MGPGLPPSASVMSVAFSPDGKMLACSGWDRTVRWWRLADGAAVRVLKGHTAYVAGVAF